MWPATLGRTATGFAWHDLLGHLLAEKTPLHTVFSFRILIWLY
jgi:hypothetical protein